MNNIIEGLLTVEELALCVKVKPSVVRFWLHNSDIPYIKIGRQIRFDPKEVKEWILEHSNGAKINRVGIRRVV